MKRTMALFLMSVAVSSAHADTGAIVADQSKVNFGFVTADSETKTITLTNTSSAIVTDVKVQVTGTDYSVTSGCAERLQPQQTCNVNVHIVRRYSFGFTEGALFVHSSDGELFIPLRAYVVRSDER